jgi:hypothetical protein
MNRLPKILFLSGAAAILLGLGLSQLHIPLSKSESEAIFYACSLCKTPPTFKTLDPNLTYSLWAAGISTIVAGAIFVALHQPRSEKAPETMK